MEENETLLNEEEEEEEEEEEQQQQQLWSWGAGTEGQLGTGKLQDEHLPLLLLLQLPLSSAAAAGAAPISLLSCGGAHVIALTTDTGCLFTCGDGSFGQLGHGDYNSHSSPVMLSYFTSKHVEQIACGMRHSLVMLKGHSGDRVYGFGSGKRGQLGISKDKTGSTSLPQTTFGLEDIKIVGILANGDHSAALSTDGHLYTWGRGFDGSSDAYTPQCLSSSLSFIQAALGWNHALLLTGEGEVCMLGGKHHGVLGESQKMNLVKHLSDDSKETVVGKIPSLNGIKVTQIAAGAEHSALVTENGLVMTWGWGEHGQLGLGSTDDQTSPQVVKLGDKLPYINSRTKVYCGSGFTFAARTVCLPSQT